MEESADRVEFYLPATREWVDRYDGDRVKVSVYPDPHFEEWIVVRVCGSNGHSGVEGFLPSDRVNVERAAQWVRSLELPLSVADFAALNFHVYEWHWKENVPMGRAPYPVEQSIEILLGQGPAEPSNFGEGDSE